MPLTVTKGNELRNSTEPTARQRRAAEDAINGLSDYAKLWRNPGTIVCIKDNPVRIDLQNPTQSEQNLQAQIGHDSIAGVLLSHELSSDKATEEQKNEVLERVQEAFRKSMREQVFYVVGGTL